MALYRHTKEDMHAFMEAVNDICPGAPKKPHSNRLNRLMLRWEARKVVRELFPSLTPKDPEYFAQVDAAEAPKV